jgi:hypothetical protein
LGFSVMPWSMLMKMARPAPSLSCKKLFQKPYAAALILSVG